MIKEYNPLEENAKTRWAKRKAELAQRKQEEKQRADELVQMQPPKDPRPWKGKPSSFFELNAYTRGSHKYLTNEQKEFFIIHYPDSVADPFSMLGFLRE